MDDFQITMLFLGLGLMGLKIRKLCDNVEEIKNMIENYIHIVIHKKEEKKNN